MLTQQIANSAPVLLRDFELSLSQLLANSASLASNVKVIEIYTCSSHNIEKSFFCSLHALFILILWHLSFSHSLVFSLSLSFSPLPLSLSLALFLSPTSLSISLSPPPSLHQPPSYPAHSPTHMYYVYVPVNPIDYAQVTIKIDFPDHPQFAKLCLLLYICFSSLNT